MRRVRYGVGMSLDGFIADPADGTGYLVQEPTYDPRPFFDSIDTDRMGRGSFQMMLRQGSRSMPGMRNVVCSRTLRPEDFPEVTVVTDALAAVAALRAEAGKDIWL